MEKYYEQAVECVKGYVLTYQRELYNRCGKDFDKVYEVIGDSDMYTGAVIEPGHIYELSYTKCTCQKVLSGEITNPEHCECTRQSILYVLKEIEPNASFEVEILDTVLRGSSRCRFRIIVEKE